MSRIQRITSAVTGIVLLLVSAGMIYLGREGFYLVLALLTISLTAAGLRQLYYYLTMARHMVGGWKILFQSVVILDLGMITLTLSTADIHPRYIMLYLIGVNLFNAAVDILKALEARRLDAPAWEFTLSAGGLELFLAVLGLFFLDSLRLVTILYCIGLVYTGIFKLVRAFRRSETVYIQ